MTGHKPHERTLTRTKLCGFTEGNASPRCDAPATAHIMVSLGIDNGGRPARLVACARHAPLARQAGNVVMGHAFGGTCEQPGASWDFTGNRCVLGNSGRSGTVREVVAVSA